MKILVGQHDLQIDKKDIINQNEYKITKCEFEFDEAITNDLVKIALFTNSAGTYKQYIVNNECDIPAEILEKQEITTLGVYAYKEENEELELRYSPEEIKFYISNGSYKEDAENTEPITPTDKEQMEQALQKGLNDINNKIDEVDEKLDGIETAIEETNGISSIEKTSTSGLVDTYTITYTNGNTTTFDVSNGNGIDRIEKTATVGNKDTYTIYFTNGSTTTYEVSNGEVTREELEEEVDRLSMIYNAFPSTTGEVEEGSINGTAEVPFKEIGLKGNTSQNGEPTPDTPIPVNVVTGDNSITISNNDNTQSQTYPINLGSIELCKIGDYQDYLYKENGKWYKYGAIGKVVLDGSENWRTNASWNYTNTNNYYTNLGSSNDNLLSNHFTYEAGAYGLDTNGIMQRIWTTNLLVRINKSLASDVSAFTTWLSTHNTTVYYVLNTPTITEITDTTLIEQLDNLEKAYSYDTQTNISQTNQDKPFIISYEAILSLRNVLNS